MIAPRIAFVLLLLNMSFFMRSQGEQAERLAPENLTVEMYKKIVSRTDKVVLVNFSADWCVVCKRQAPVLDAISKKYGSKLLLVEVDMDNNRDIAAYFEVDGLPFHMIYKKGGMAWNWTGFLSEQQLTERLGLYIYP